MTRIATGRYLKRDPIATALRRIYPPILESSDSIDKVLARLDYQESLTRTRLTAFSDAVADASASMLGT